MKDFLEEQGFNEVKSPRDSIKKAFETGLISDGHGWLKLMEDRNLTSHAYDEETAKEIEKLIPASHSPREAGGERQKYYKLLKELHTTFKNKQK